jgi:hypothetical protein
MPSKAKREYGQYITLYKYKGFGWMRQTGEILPDFATLQAFCETRHMYKYDIFTVKCRIANFSIF